MITVCSESGSAPASFLYHYSNLRQLPSKPATSWLKALTGIFLEAGRQIAKEYEGRVACDDRIVYGCAMQLVLNPWQFDVIVTTNLFGDVLSDRGSRTATVPNSVATR